MKKSRFEKVKEYCPWAEDNPALFEELYRLFPNDLFVDLSAAKVANIITLGMKSAYALGYDEGKAVGWDFGYNAYKWGCDE